MSKYMHLVHTDYHQLD